RLLTTDQPCQGDVGNVRARDGGSYPHEVAIAAVMTRPLLDPPGAVNAQLLAVKDGGLVRRELAVRDARHRLTAGRADHAGHAIALADRPAACQRFRACEWRRLATERFFFLIESSFVPGGNNPPGRFTFSHRVQLCAPLPAFSSTITRTSW